MSEKTPYLGLLAATNLPIQGAASTHRMLDMAEQTHAEIGRLVDEQISWADKPLPDVIALTPQQFAALERRYTGARERRSRIAGRRARSARRVWERSCA